MKRSASTNNYRFKIYTGMQKMITGLNEFEGGFTPRQNNDMNDFDAHTTNELFHFRIYFENKRIGTIVFNTPAMIDCHGWKLTEFLAQRLHLAKQFLITLIIKRNCLRPLYMKNIFEVAENANFKSSHK